MIKEKKQEKRKNKWKKRICLTEEQYNYLKLEMKRKKYKTMAGTLDLIINKYKANQKKKPLSLQQIEKYDFGDYTEKDFFDPSDFETNPVCGVTDFSRGIKEWLKNAKSIFLIINKYNKLNNLIGECNSLKMY